MHEADFLPRLLLRIHLNKLAVVYFEERFRDGSIFARQEGLLKAKLLVEVVGTLEIGDADGDMGDPGKCGWGRYLRHPRRGNEEQGYRQQESTKKPHSVVGSKMPPGRSDCSSNCQGEGTAIAV